MDSNPLRRSVSDTWKFLEADGLKMPRTTEGEPLVRSTMPSIYDEEPLSFSFFRTGVEAADFSNMSLPRTFFGRSTFVGVNFRNTDLAESRMCWNDFESCDFSGADLSRCDMRASNFNGCMFVGAVLTGADIRRSSFEDCDFTGAMVNGAVAEDEDAIGCVQDYLEGEQQAVMA